MKRGRSTGAPTAAQKRRFAAIQEIGCICCRDMGRGFVPAEIHHLTIGGRHGQKRRGHDATVGLCAWHHRGVTAQGFAGITYLIRLGPSYALKPREFREQWPDEWLLETQNRLIDALNETTIGAKFA